MENIESIQIQNMAELTEEEIAEDAICRQSNTGDKNGSFENEENLNVTQKCLNIASNGNKQGHEECIGYAEQAIELCDRI